MRKQIIRKDEILKINGKKNIHFLNPNAVRIDKSLGDLVGLEGIGFHIIEVPMGKESTEYHAHQFENECVYILHGEAEVIIGEESFQVSEGDFIAYPAKGLAHTMKNIGDDTLRCIVVGERLAHDVCDYPKKRKRLYINHGQPWELVDHDNITVLK
ncbi:MAG: cupin domain-containing protein [Candidatus Zeuxoniibacter abyssi]|nr:MAG: cupin domain-containing protein [Candidatus Persebacteraceae bacterium AB1(2)]